MKKLLLLVFVAIFVAACQTPVEEPMEDEFMLKSGKLDICHWDEDNQVYIPISVPEVAYQKAHLAQGGKLSYSPEGKYIFKKTVNRPSGEVIGFYDIILDKLEVGATTFTGSGIRDIGDGRIAYVKINGTTSDGSISFRIDQWIDNPEMTGDPMNWWELTGSVDECDGITSILCERSRESTHIWTVEEVVEI